ncbi:MAG: type II toxin-antitoxin system VapC family toxin [Okeania sp. SIO2H7]|nr:type II toxin-antitoxin system VapC family toxin [Okeania sp. SIO2H7]
MNYLLDTDTCIYWIKGRQPVRDKLLEVGWEEVGICAITVAELYYGAYNSNRVTENLNRIDIFMGNLSVLPLSDRALRQFGELKAELRRRGEPLADLDLLIASVALVGSYTLVTNNTRHYDRIDGLTLENWTI